MLAAIAVTALGAMGCKDSDESADAGPLAGIFGGGGPAIPAGTTFDVVLSTQVSSETAKPGDAWSGTLASAVVVDGEVLAPAGAAVQGEVSEAVEAKRGDRAKLDLRVTSIEVSGKTRKVNAGTEPVIAGSPRARNLGAIAGGAAAGAIIGKAVGGDAEDAAAGAIIGGTAAGVGVAASKGYQVVLKSGTRLGFTVH
jgi:hypothetical protein